MVWKTMVGLYFSAGQGLTSSPSPSYLVEVMTSPGRPDWWFRDDLRCCGNILLRF